MLENNSLKDYKDIGEKIQNAEFKGVVVTKLQYIENSLSGLKEDCIENSDRIVSLERFQSNMVGKFTIIGAVILIVVNWAWDIGSGFIKSLK